ncbi:MAG: ABC transporter ATP-binding protein [Clostridiales bacterium]|jgi:putative ABC transport system ATP-binding protein|nr:ABC transporter ATP-binding protein [Clostridiales bacterium]
MFEIDDLTKNYGSFTALKNINLKIDEGDYIAVTGRSGSGKSTLLHIIGGLDRPTYGMVLYNGENLVDFSEKRIAKYRNLDVGFIFQSFNLEPSYSVYKNLEIPLLIAGVDKKTRDEKIRENAERLGMQHKLKNLANNLSGGEKQRVAIARALMNDAKILLADEPCGNLDSANSKIIMDILDGLNNNGITIMLVTHQDNDAKRAKRLIYLLDGEIVNENKD